MTPYTSKDLQDGFEFKIIRSVTGGFADPFKLRAILQEEGRAGWTLLEKFDNYRVRLKRPVTAREADATLGFDPYRVWIGMEPVKFAIMLVGGIFAVVGAGIAFLVATLAH